MGRSVSSPSGAIVAYRILECEDDDDWDFAYQDLIDSIIDEETLLMKGRLSIEMKYLGKGIQIGFSSAMIAIYTSVMSKYIICSIMT